MLLRISLSIGIGLGMSKPEKPQEGTLASLQPFAIKSLLWLAGYKITQTHKEQKSAAKEFGKRRTMAVIVDPPSSKGPILQAGTNYLDHIEDLKMYAWLLGYTAEKIDSYLTRAESGSRADYAKLLNDQGFIPPLMMRAIVNHERFFALPLRTVGRGEKVQIVGGDGTEDNPQSYNGMYNQ